jgi:hypothetical protein
MPPAMITGVTRAEYRLQATIDGPSGWMLNSATVSGRDVLDVPVDLRQSVDGLVVTFSDRPAELSGIVRDGSGKPIAADTIVLFSADRTLWTARSRRIRAEQSAADGTYQFRLLPAGEYYVAAVDDVDDFEWYDPVLLDRLAVSSALKTTIAEGEKKSFDLVHRAAGR